MKGVGRFTFLDDVAVSDCALEIEGESLDDLFATAALALATVMVDPTTIAVTIERTLTLAAPELDLLLYDWLSELIYVKDRDRQVFTRPQVHVEGTGPFELTARVAGGVIDPETTALGTDPKAVTFHQFALVADGSTWRARVVIDL